MRRVLAILVLLLLAGAGGAAFAARDLGPDRLPSGEQVELVVFEVEGCNYCEVLRRDVLPAYALTPRAAEVPLRFLDVNQTSRVQLAGPIEIVPTVVLVRGSREAGRITGYPGPDSFFKLVRALLTH